VIVEDDESGGVQIEYSNGSACSGGYMRTIAKLECAGWTEPSDPLDPSSDSTVGGVSYIS
jgi:hypothetical protein